MLGSRDKTKYNYLQTSFEKELQRCYLRNSTPPKPQSPEAPEQRFSAPRSSQFSPYQNREQNLRERMLVQQLQAHNTVLSEQLTKYKVMVEQMQAELKVRTEEFKNLETLRQREKLLHEQAEGQMREEIGLLLTKNTYLEGRALALDQELRGMEGELAEARLRARSASVAVHDPSPKILQTITSILRGQTSNKQTDKRHKKAGKSLNQTFSSFQSPHISPRGNSGDIVDEVEQMVKKIRKYEQLRESIEEMQCKITGKKIASEGQDLKQIWKWLKELGHQYNIGLKWKKMLAELLNLGRDTEQLSLDQVLQKMVLRLHSSDNK